MWEFCEVEKIYFKFQAELQHDGVTAVCLKSVKCSCFSTLYNFVYLGYSISVWHRIPEYKWQGEFCFDA